jgi:hypothetical protein
MVLWVVGEAPGVPVGLTAGEAPGIPVGLAAGEAPGVPVGFTPIRACRNLTVPRTEKRRKPRALFS